MDRKFLARRQRSLFSLAPALRGEGWGEAIRSAEALQIPLTCILSPAKPLTITHNFGECRLCCQESLL